MVNYGLSLKAFDCGTFYLRFKNFIIKYTSKNKASARAMPIPNITAIV
jgi:hypothetical protein